MRRFVLVLVLTFLILVNLKSASALEKSEELRSLITDIHILNLINGLYLSKEQMKDLAKEAKLAKEIRESYESMVEESESCEVLENLKNELINGGEVSKRIEESVHRFQGMRDEIEEEMNKEFEPIVKKVRKILNENQLCLLEDYTPCLIPPKKGTRIGQAKNDFGFEKHLRRLRDIPEAKFNESKEYIVDEMIKRAEKHFKIALSKKVVEDEKKRIMSILEKVRRFSDVDFETQKEDIIDELRPFKKISGGKNKEEKIIKEFLLNEKTVTLLEEKVKMKEDD